MNAELLGRISSEHMATVRTLAYSLIQADEAGWHIFATIIEVRLTEQERAALAFYALRSQPRDHAFWTAEAAVNGRMSPITEIPFIDTPAGRAALIAWRGQRDLKGRRAA